MVEPPTGKITFVATGRLVTEVICPVCCLMFHLDHDADRVQVQCLGCKAELIVRRQ